MGRSLSGIRKILLLGALAGMPTCHPAPPERSALSIPEYSGRATRVAKHCTAYCEKQKALCETGCACLSCDAVLVRNWMEGAEAYLDALDRLFVCLKYATSCPGL